mmetsp:Transcript_21324/g.55422  ORF Transcript_21324/g.55422 Transcript_21324/m.55422 type:complete len:99 (-) Transcript_21324:3480-3776(-)
MSTNRYKRPRDEGQSGPDETEEASAVHFLMCLVCSFQMCQLPLSTVLLNFHSIVLALETGAAPYEKYMTVPSTLTFKSVSCLGAQRFRTERYGESAEE